MRAALQEADPFALAWLARKVCVAHEVLAADLSLRDDAARHNPQLVFDAIQYSTARHATPLVSSPLLVAFTLLLLLHWPTGREQ